MRDPDDRAQLDKRPVWRALEDDALFLIEAAVVWLLVLAAVIVGCFAWAPRKGSSGDAVVLRSLVADAA